MIDFGYKTNELVRHDEICTSFGCGCMGGIRYSKKNNAVLLFMKNDTTYTNSWDGDILTFMGSGKGNQSANTKSNRRLTESLQNDTAVYLFEWVDSINLKFVGQMKLCEEPETKTIINKLGDAEQKVFFKLKNVG